MIAAGFTTNMLGDFGADVISVEHPEHRDPVRTWPPFEDGVSLWWKSLGRNKRAITLDLSTDDGCELALKLVKEADVVVENFRPGTMERWGLGYDDLSSVNERVIMLRISGYGQDGPRANQPGFGTVAEGLAGWAEANGFPDREPLLPPISLADLTAAQFAVQATMFAIYERDVGNGGGSGKGQVIDVSLYEPLFRLFVGEVEKYDKQGKVRTRTGNLHPNAAPRNIYETADGFISLSASSQKIFENVMDAIGREDLIEDTRFETNESRVENAVELDAYIESWTRERTSQEVIETMEHHDAIVGPIYDMADIFADDHFHHRENIIEVDDADLGRLRTFGVVPKLSRTPGSISHTGPSRGEHNEQVYLGELGLDRTDYDQLQDTGVI